MAEPATGFRTFAAEALAPLGIRLRAAATDDLPLLAAIYGSTREEELRPVPWSTEEKRAFSDWQSRQQEAHYALHYAGAERLVIERRESSEEPSSPIGRLYVHTTAAEVRLMDVTLMTDRRNQGLGTRLVTELLRYADSLKRPVSLHVEPFNPAKQMYERMGFMVVETRGVYEFMVRAAFS